MTSLRLSAVLLGGTRRRFHFVKIRNTSCRIFLSLEPFLAARRLFAAVATKKKQPAKAGCFFGAGGGGRTRTVSLPLDFESSTSANSITPAYNGDSITHIGEKIKGFGGIFCRLFLWGNPKGSGRGERPYGGWIFWGERATDGRPLWGVARYKQQKRKAQRLCLPFAGKFTEATRKAL